VTSAGGDRPLPVADRDSTPWWAGLAEHVLRLQRCDACATLRWPPRALCNRCGSLDWSWVAVSGRATTASWIVNRHAFSEAFGVPFVVVMARLDEQDDILLPGAYGGAPDGHDLHIGRRLVVAFDDVAVPEGADPVSLLRWMPATDEGP
jgi:uncharacterized OB-fold protein